MEDKTQLLINQRFAEEIERLKKAKFIATVQKLAKQTGINRTTFSNIKANEQNATAEHMAKVKEIVSEFDIQYVISGFRTKPNQEDDPYVFQPPAKQDPITAMYNWMMKMEREVDQLKRELDVIKKG